ncbi:fructose-bisphosphate aldolase 1, chloroplastic [Olea europaea subsp. europaea]|uniref:fructose-bisphosphate aldolase n=1 Tax=Olea europaea subsp. europaea TaxID=158383 RepID=A0A8S0PGK6_OLEEU|nr:fructose-bisphosphate aldolase 1, chloroplastic [Olea europaea subsp. europaea]
MRATYLKFSAFIVVDVDLVRSSLHIDFWSNIRFKLQIMSPGAKVLMALLPVLLLTTNRVDRFAKWRTIVSIPDGPSALAVKETAWGLVRYAAISQVLTFVLRTVNLLNCTLVTLDWNLDIIENCNGLVPIMEPEIFLDGEHGIDRTFKVAQKV